MANRRRVPTKADLENTSPITEDELEFSVNPGDENADDVFMHSLDKLGEKDIGKSGDGQVAAKKKKKSSPVTVVVFVISVAVFIGCAIYLVNNFIEKKEGSDLYDGLAEKYFTDIDFGEGSAVEEDVKDDGAVSRLSRAKSAQRVLCLADRILQGNTPVTGNYDQQLEQLRASITALSAQNSDTYGWIRVPGTSINYPVMQYTDNNFYLDHDYNKKYLVVGSIFADYRINKTIYRNFNSVFYGHNLTTGGMFHDVTKFLDEEFFNNTLIYVYTMDGVYVYEPFAIFEANAEYNYFRTEFDSTASFIEFATEMQDNSIHTKRMEFVSTDRMLTLSTCTNGAQSQRWCLQAKLVQVIN